MIDINYIIENSREYSEIIKKVEIYRNKELKKFDYILVEINRKKQQFKAKKILTFDALSKLEKEIIDLENDYFKKTQYIEILVAKYEEDLKFPLLKNIIIKSQDICKEFNCLILLEKSSTVLYQNKSVKEISNLIIKELANKEK